MGDELVSELDRRRELIRLVKVEGLTKAEAGRRLGRSRQWVHKWLGRYNGEGDAGLADRSRAPQRRPTETSADVVAKVLTVRDQLEAHPYANIGGLAILAVLEQQRYRPLPSLRTIERILTRAGKSRLRRPGTRSSKNTLPLPDVTGRPGIWQQADWVQNRFLTGGTVFNSLQISDVASHVIAAGQYPTRTLLNAVTVLIEDAWPQMAIPQAISIDNAFVATTHRNNPWTIWVRICLFFGVEVVTTPPGTHGWNNHIEAVNNLWQDRTIRRHHYRTLDDLRTGSNEACRWFNHHRPVLDPDRCGTRYPAEYVAAHRHQLRWPPDITITDYLNHHGQPVIPLTTGRLTYLRIVNQHHIAITRTHWPVPLPDGALVAATITTADHTLTITRHGHPVATYPYPIHHTVTDPYYPPAPTSLFAHI
jgi:putative transposase